MNSLNRRQAITAVSTMVAAPWVARYANAAEFTLKYASDRPATHPADVEVAAVVKRIREETNGRVEIQMFPNNQLGGDADMLSQLRAGAINFFCVSGMLVSPLVPVSAIHGLGFAFRDYDSIWKAMDGGLGAYIRGEIQKTGLQVMNRMWDSGYRQVTTASKPITSPADLRGFKIRVPAAPMWVSLFKALGASPASIHAGELYSSLQTRIVDGQENPLPITDSFKLYEVQKYCCLTNHMWDGYWILADRRGWSRLPPDVQEIVARNWDLGALNERKSNLEMTQRLNASLATRGMIFNSPELEPFRQKLRESGFYAEWRQKFGEEAWTQLERYTGKLA